MLFLEMISNVISCPFVMLVKFWCRLWLSNICESKYTSKVWFCFYITFDIKSLSSSIVIYDWMVIVLPIILFSWRWTMISGIFNEKNYYITAPWAEGGAGVGEADGSGWFDIKNLKQIKYSINVTLDMYLIIRWLFV